MLVALLAGASPTDAQSLGGGGTGGRHGASKPVGGGAGARSGTHHVDIGAGGGGGGGGGAHHDKRSGNASTGHGGAGGSGKHGKGGGDGGAQGTPGFNGWTGVPDGWPLPAGQAFTGGSGGAGQPGGNGDDGQPFGGIWGHDSGSGGGGGGGASGAMINDKEATFLTAPITGGKGGDGGAAGRAGAGVVGMVGLIPGSGYGGAGGGGGGGGGGGVGLVQLQAGEILVRSSIAGGGGGVGGAGGAGGDGAGGVIGQNCQPGLPCFVWGMDGGDGYYGGSGGTGGDGGAGFYAYGASPIIVQNEGVIRGGDAGAGGAGGRGGGGKSSGTGGAGGNGGNGGDGVVLTTGSSLEVQAGGFVGGGKGGAGGTGGASGYNVYGFNPGSDGAMGHGGRGGRGVSGGGGVRVVSAGRIEGGLNADGSHADAINLTGGGNTLELRAGYHFLGNVVLTRDAGNPNALVLGGWQDASFDFATLGGATQAFGTFEKDGASTWTVTGTAAFGNVRVRSGELALSGTARLTSASASIDAEAGSSAAVTISGSGVTWANANAFVIGDRGNGMLAIAGGGQMKGGSTVIGAQAGASGTVTLTGAGTSWDNFSLVVGEGGQGQVTVSGGAKLSSNRAEIGAKAGSSGSVTVTGNGSSWDASNRGGGYSPLRIGNGGLTISNGGYVNGGSMLIGTLAGATGSVIVSGAGSMLYAGDLAIGSGGSGVLTLSAGGALKFGGRILYIGSGGSSGTLNIGAAAGAAATAAGQIVGGYRINLTSNGTLVFNHTETDYTFSSNFEGSGHVQLLSGTTIFDRYLDASGFTGDMTVANSTLVLSSAKVGGSLAISSAGQVEGEGSIGAATINSGGTLAPSGKTSLTVNGNLTANSGGTIKPSDAAALIVNGTLTLNPGSNYDYRLHGYGASLPGSATTRVNGNLVLNGGTLNLSSSSQPAIGYHRVITYTGGLTGSGLVIGGMPSTGPFAYNYAVDVSQAGKVDVVITPNGLTILQLWGTTPAGGGSGVWNAGNANWFDLGGSTATQWGGAYGVFRGPGGTVTIDGAQNVVGLQFAGGSYTLVGGAGGSLNLHGYNNGGIVITTPEIRVLDGETARINATITGTDGLEKTGDGTLILGGANSYRGGTTISGGTLQISADANLGAASGGLTLDNGALRTTAHITSNRTVLLRDTGAIETDAGTTLTLSSTVGGAGGLIKWGDGTLLLTGANSWSGGTLITAGTLRAGSAGALPTMTDWVLTGGRLDLSGHDLSMRLLAGSGGEIALGGADLTVDQADDSVYAGTVTGAGRLLKDGAGTLLLTGASSYSGGTVIRDGTLAIIADANLGDAGSAIAFDGGGRLATYADITSGRSVALSGTGTIETYAGTTFILGGSVSGAGSLVKEGWGTLTLTGSASHGGGTTVNAGMLQIGNGGTTGELAGNVVNDAILSFDRSNDYTFSGAISGGGVVVQSGTGTTILTGNNSYSGGTLIRAGALQVSNDGNLGASGGAITFLGGALRFGASFSTDRTVLLIGTGTVDTNGHDATLTGGVYGYGDLIKTGTGSLRLTGTNYYRSTIVEAGTLVGDAASISGNIANNGAVVFDQRNDASLASVFSGTGMFTKAGGGALELTGDSSGFSGETTVSAGMLVVNGALGGGLDVQSGARLQGSGTVGSTMIRFGATIAPGNSIGTLTVSGDITFERGATYEVEVSPDGASSDLIRASGKARLSGGSVVHIGEDGTYWANQRYTILTASQGVEGRFDQVSSRYLFLDPSLEYGADSVALTLLRNDLPFAAIAQTRNQAQTALGLESLGEANPLWLSFTQLRDEGEARRAYDSLSGEIHASTKTALIEGSQTVRGAISDRIRAAFDGIGAPRIATLAYASGKGAVATAPAESFALWARGFGSWGQTRGDGNAASLTRSSNGLVAGFDIATAQEARLGITAGYSRSKFEVARRLSRGEADNYHVGLYGGARFDRFRLTAAMSYAWHELSTRRSVSFPDFGEQLSSKYEARSLQAFGEIAYRFDLGPAAFEPFANLAYINLRSGAFTETGGVAALSARGQTTAVAFATLGLRAQMRFDLGSMPLRLDTTLAWRRAAGDIAPRSLQSFAGGSSFSIAGVPIARDALVVGAGLALTVAPDAELALGYDGQLAQRASDHTFNARLAVKF
ncbi:autotransporter domain-containing protein [Bosea sp. NPDC055332]